MAGKGETSVRAVRLVGACLGAGNAGSGRAGLGGVGKGEAAAAAAMWGEELEVAR